MILIDIEAGIPSDTDLREWLLWSLLKDAGFKCELQRENDMKSDNIVAIRLTNSSTERETKEIKSFDDSSKSSNYDESRRYEKSRKNHYISTFSDRGSVGIKELSTNGDSQVWRSIAMQTISIVKSLQIDLDALIRKYFELLEVVDLRDEMLHDVFWNILPLETESFGHIPPVASPETESDHRIDEWVIGELIDEGHYSTVSNVKRLSPPEFVFDTDGQGSYFSKQSSVHKPAVVKRFCKKDVVEVQNVRRLSREIQALKTFCHPNIIGFCEVIHTTHYVYIFQEHGGIDLRRHLCESMRPMPELFAKSIMTQLISAVEYIATKHGMVHRDIKPENILLLNAHTSAPKVKLIDFGCATHHGDICKGEICGTIGFFAPEMLLGTNCSNSKIDAWSLGCVLLEILLGSCRFADIWMPSYASNLFRQPILFDHEISKSILTVRAIFSGPLSRHLFYYHVGMESCFKACMEQKCRSMSCRAFLMALLTKNPEQRPSLSEIEKLSFLQQRESCGCYKDPNFKTQSQSHVSILESWDGCRSRKSVPT